MLAALVLVLSALLFVAQAFASGVLIVLGAVVAVLIAIALVSGR